MTGAMMGTMTGMQPSYPTGYIPQFASTPYYPGMTPGMTPGMMMPGMGMPGMMTPGMYGAYPSYPMATPAHPAAPAFPQPLSTASSMHPAAGDAAAAAAGGAGPAPMAVDGAGGAGMAAAMPGMPGVPGTMPGTMPGMAGARAMGLGATMGGPGMYGYSSGYPSSYNMGAMGGMGMAGMAGMACGYPSMAWGTGYSAVNPMTMLQEQVERAQRRMVAMQREEQLRKEVDEMREVKRKKEIALLQRKKAMMEQLQQLQEQKRDRDELRRKERLARQGQRAELEGELEKMRQSIARKKEEFRAQQQRRLQMLQKERDIVAQALKDAQTQCRFCDDTILKGRPQHGIEACCAKDECREVAARSCTKIRACKHPCCGVRDETVCPPCLYCDVDRMQDRDDDCPICFTDPLGKQPCVALPCGHILHHDCVQRLLHSRWPTKAISFAFARCPLDQEPFLPNPGDLASHPALQAEIGPIMRLRDDVKRKALLRLEYEKDEELAGFAKSAAGQEEAFAYAMDWSRKGYQYFQCFRCKQPYFGGLYKCEAAGGEAEADEEGGAAAAAGEDVKREDMVCTSCSGGAAGGVAKCDKHGDEFISWKCKFCCSPAVWFCWGTTHFCDPCHTEPARVNSCAKEKLPKCPAGPKLVQLRGECQLKQKHPDPGCEFPLGCGMCHQEGEF